MILVTGGTGLVGTHLIYELLNSGENVRAIKRKNSKTEKVRKIISYYHENPDELLKNLEWTEADILDVFSLEDAMKGIDKVYHVAAIVSFNPKDHQQMIENNIKGTANIVNLCIEHKARLCHVSSVAAIGRDNTQNMVTENEQWVYSKKQSAYGISKFESEREVWRGIAEGLDAVIVNPSIIFGPGHWGEGSSAIFSKVWTGLKFYTKGITGFVGVKDVVHCMIKLMNSNINNERYILNGENVSYKKCFETIALELNVAKPKFFANKFLSGIVWRLEKMRSFIIRKPPLVTRETARTANKKYYFSNEKICLAINYKFEPFQKTVKETALRFLLEHKK